VGWLPLTSECDPIGQQIREEKEMPFVNVKVIEGVFSAAQKQDIVRKVTDAMVAVEGRTCAR
jgi:hypothetical protein